MAVPLLQRSHHEHATVVTWRRGRQLHLSGHALAETYSVLTRLPGDADHVLASRDARALQTYPRLGLEVELVS